MTPNDLYAFLSDKRLVDLIERVKISDDFLDVVADRNTALRHAGLVPASQ